MPSASSAALRVPVHLCTPVGSPLTTCRDAAVRLHVFCVQNGIIVHVRSKADRRQRPFWPLATSPPPSVALWLPPAPPPPPPTGPLGRLAGLQVLSSAGTTRGCGSSQTGGQMHSLHTASRHLEVLDKHQPCNALSINQAARLHAAAIHHRWPGALSTVQWPGATSCGGIMGCGRSCPDLDWAGKLGPGSVLPYSQQGGGLPCVRLRDRASAGPVKTTRRLPTVEYRIEPSFLPLGRCRRTALQRWPLPHVLSSTAIAPPIVLYPSWGRCKWTARPADPAAAAAASAAVAAVP